jgi:hypothetical protein
MLEEVMGAVVAPAFAVADVTGMADLMVGFYYISVSIIIIWKRNFVLLLYLPCFV